MRHTWRLLRRTTLPLNKVARRAGPGHAENGRQPKAWLEQINQIDPRHWVIVDESSETTELSRR
jgi:hypothetical protein